MDILLRVGDIHAGRGQRVPDTQAQLARHTSPRLGIFHPHQQEEIHARRAEIDQQKRKLIYREAELLMLADMPLLPCFTSNLHNLVRANVTGFTQLPYANFGDQFGGMQIG